MGFFVVYQIIDAMRSANAIRMGQTPPDPFGLGRTFGATERTPTSDAPFSGSASAATIEPPPSKVPTAAVVLIGLGVLFLLQTAGVFEFNVGRIWPCSSSSSGSGCSNRRGMLRHGYDPQRALQQTNLVGTDLAHDHRDSVSNPKLRRTRIRTHMAGSVACGGRDEVDGYQDASAAYPRRTTSDNWIHGRIHSRSGKLSEGRSCAGKSAVPPPLFRGEKWLAQFQLLASERDTPSPVPSC